MDVENTFDNVLLDGQMCINNSKHIILPNSANKKASKLKQRLSGFRGAAKIGSNRFAYTEMKNAPGVIYVRDNTVIASVRDDLLVSIADLKDINKFM